METTPALHDQMWRLLGRQLYAARQRSGLSVAEAARRLEVSILEMARLEMGASRLRTVGEYESAVELLAAPRAAET